MTIKLKRNFSYKENKNIYLMQNPKKLLNRYFFKNKNYIEVQIRREIILGIPKFIFKIIFQRLEILKLYNDFPRNFTLKQCLINFYSLLILSRGIRKYSKSILIIGDYQNALNMSLLQLSDLFFNVEFWIIFQGSGSMEKKINFKYPKKVTKVFFPFSSESSHENNLLSKASSINEHIIFYNIDTTINLKLSKNSNKLAIFHGYNKKYKLYPIYIFKIIKEIILINLLQELNKFNKVDFFLHPRLKYLLILRYFNLKSNFKYKIFDPINKYKYEHIISYSPTINSSLKKLIKFNINYVYEVGDNFNKKNFQKYLNNLLNLNK